MGGFGSGGHSTGSRYLASEVCFGLDLARLKRAGFLVPGKEASGPWEWCNTRDPETTTGSVRVAVDLRDLDAPAFTITYAIDGERIDIRGELLTTTPRYGGVRYWWRCPWCWHKRRILYAYPGLGRERFACRTCYRLRYYSHTESREDRLLRKAKKLWHRAGNGDGTEPWQKPKWMRWATFSRLVLEGRAAQEAGDRIAFRKMGLALASITNRRGAA
jgi:hypothetical protein